MQKVWKITPKCIPNGAQNLSENRKYAKQMHADNRRWILTTPGGGTLDRRKQFSKYRGTPATQLEIHGWICDIPSGCTESPHDLLHSACA